MNNLARSIVWPIKEDKIQATIRAFRGIYALFSLYGLNEVLVRGMVFYHKM